MSYSTATEHLCKAFKMSEEEELQLVQSSEEEDEEEEDGPKICQVCGDQANGYHFNAMTCEGCKGFFRRAMKRPGTFRCPSQRNCVITKSNRRQCQACRLQKCLSIGMRKEMIMSDAAVEERRWKIKRKKLLAEPPSLTPEQEELIQELVKAHEQTFDRSCSHFNQFRPLDRFASPTDPLWTHGQGDQGAIEEDSTTSFSSSVSSLSSTSSSSASVPSEGQAMLPQAPETKSTVVFTSLSHISDLSTYMIQNVINYAKTISAFRALTIEDQISLLKGATFEMVQIRFNMLFNERTGIWECGSLHYCINDAARAGFQPLLLDPLMKFHYTLRHLHLHDVEYALMQAISLFSPDRPGVSDREIICHQQEKLAITLQTFIENKREDKDKHLLFPKIMSLLTEFRTMNEEYTKQVMHIQDIQPELSPLILEVVSPDS